MINKPKICIQCSASSVVKNGKSKKGKQTYLCKACNRRFVIEYVKERKGNRSKKDAYNKFLNLKSNKSNKELAKELNVSSQTIWRWRQKMNGKKLVGHKKYTKEDWERIFSNSNKSIL